MAVLADLRPDAGQNLTCREVAWHLALPSPQVSAALTKLVRDGYADRQWSHDVDGYLYWRTARGTSLLRATGQRP